MPFGPQTSLIVVLAIAVLVLAVVVAYRHGRAAADRAREAAEQEAVAARRDVHNMHERMKEFEKDKQEFIRASKAGALESAKELTGQMLDERKQENAKYLEQYEKIAASMGVLRQQVLDSQKTTDVVMRSLSNPLGAGHFAEWTLENLLTSMGLEPGQDFLLQHTVDDIESGGRLRPDGMVFVPPNTVIVIDAKASKHVLAIAQAEADGDVDSDALYGDLAKTMNDHLKLLSQKNYREAVTEWYRSSGHGEPGHVMNIMYLQSDGAVERLFRADPDFAARAGKSDITIVGRSGLSALLSSVHHTIGVVRQEENQESIISEVRTLLSRLSQAFGHMDDVGKSLRQMADRFGKFAGSVNQRVLPSARKLEKLGVTPADGKPLLSRVARYHVAQLEDVIEGESEEVDEAPELTDQRGDKAG